MGIHLFGCPLENLELMATFALGKAKADTIAVSKKFDTLLVPHCSRIQETLGTKRAEEKIWRKLTNNRNNKRSLDRVVLKGLNLLRHLALLNHKPEPTFIQRQQLLKKDGSLMSSPPSSSVPNYMSLIVSAIVKARLTTSSVPKEARIGSHEHSRVSKSAVSRAALLLLDPTSHPQNDKHATADFIWLLDPAFPV
nr:hypothetical protein [Tanacetum cinerariifolium]